MSDRISVFRDESGQWRWHLIAPNGQIIATSGESFTRRWSAARAAKRALLERSTP